MAQRSGLIPTVITNKNGHLTTVYRKPVTEPTPDRISPPSPADNDRKLYLLKKKLSDRIAATKTHNYEFVRHQRIIKDAIESNDAQKLERLDKHFDLHGKVLTTTYSAIEQSGLDTKDDALFERVLMFTNLTQCSYPQPSHVAEFIPLIQKHNIEELAHCVNLCTTGDDIATIEDTVAMLNSTPEPILRAPAVLTLSQSDTPVSDMNLVTEKIHRKQHWDAYEVLAGFDRQTVSLLANALRSGVPAYTLALELRSHEGGAVKEELLSRRAAEYTALIMTVQDELRTTNVDILEGANGTRFSVAFYKSFGALADDPSSYDGQLPLDTDEDLQKHAALLRFMLNVNDIQHLGVFEANPKSSRLAYRANHEWVELIRSRNTREETSALVTYFNERGINTSGAEKYFTENEVAPLRTGWL